MRDAMTYLTRGLRDLARALGPRATVDRLDCGAYHHLVPHVSCTRRFNHRGRHAGTSPDGKVRWEQ